jgi:hypothetical protein
VTCFLSPFLTLPLSNKFAMRHIAGVTKKYSYKADPLNHLVKLSNKYLGKGADIQSGVKSLLEKHKINTTTSEIFKNAGGTEKFRQKIINAKLSVLASDLVFTTGALGGVSFLNNYLTKKKTNRDGFSAEFNMAEKGVIDKRAEKFKQNAGYRQMAFGAVLAALALAPLALKHGLNAKTTSKLGNFIKKRADWADYDDGIFLRRFPLILVFVSMVFGRSMAARNETEVKDHIVRSTVAAPFYFLGDVALGSLFAKLSDKVLKTNLIDNKDAKTIMHKILPPVKRIKDMDKRSQKYGSAIMWLNIALLSVMMGTGLPYVMNKFIKSEVDKDTRKNKLNHTPT